MRILIAACLMLLLAVPSFAQDDPPLDPETLTAREVIQLPLPASRMHSGAFLSPVNDNFYMQFKGAQFCLTTMLGVAGQCADFGNLADIDPESISWSPDGRYIAFTGKVLVYFRDSDIWVLDVETGVFTNLTDDGFDDNLQFSDEEELPENVWVDIAPEWMPDGRLSFVRHAVDFEQHQPQLWVIDPDGGEPEMLAELIAPSEFSGYVSSTDWSPDGSKLAFIYTARGNPDSGLWIYDAAEGEAQPLASVPEPDRSFIRADFSPDGESLLLLTQARENYQYGSYDARQSSGYYIVPVGSGQLQPLTVGLFIMSVGWLPDGGLIYIGYERFDLTVGGLFVMSALDATPRKVLDYPEIDGDLAPVFAPTPDMSRPLEISASGRLLFGTDEGITLLVQLE